MSERSTRWLEIHLLGWWHPGTGQGDGVVADASVARGSDGLPVLGGRAVKGLLAQALRLGADAGLPLRVVDLVGSELPKGDADDRVSTLEAARYVSAAGSLRVSSARLGRTAAEQQAWSTWARSEGAAARVEALVRRLSSTRLDEEGVADDHTLRTVEVWAPMTLRARVEGPADLDWGAVDQAVRLFWWGLGTRRNRGFGRCAVRVVDGEG